MLGSSVFGGIAPLAAQPVSPPLRTLLRQRLPIAGMSAPLTVGDARLQMADTLLRFYAQRDYQPAWIDQDGALPRVQTLLTVLSAADREGFWPQDYHLSQLEVRWQEFRQRQATRTPLALSRLIDLELLCTDAFLLYGSHAWSGRFPPAQAEPGWSLDRDDAAIDLAAFLQHALTTSTVAESLHNLLPHHPVYTGLRQALEQYRRLSTQGDWPLVPAGPTMYQGERSPRVVALRARLLASGDLAASAHAPDAELFDATLEHAVRTVQQRHGFAPDGVVGPQLVATLNVPVEERMRQLEINLERWRWLPREFGARYLLVNIANFALEVREHNQPVLTMRTVVGRPDRQTPVLRGALSHLVLSPTWHVPARIALQDKLPLIRKNPGYLARHGFQVFRGNQEVDPRTIHWAQMTHTNFPYTFRQRPGATNALGRVKFLFPNPFDVYLHDTPSRELFQETVRAFSSGCIRLEKPLDLAAYLLRDNPTWTPDKIRAASERPHEQVVSLATPFPVYVLYWTAWADADGRVQFRPDIYERDVVLGKRLHQEGAGRLVVARAADVRSDSGR
jgi:murein L,D-transpeptidase YcbB/YkuD